MVFRKTLLKIWPILVIVTLLFIFFWKFFLKGLLPIPADIIVGLYYPWLDYKWGYMVGVPVKNNLVSDVVSVFYPFKNYAIEVLKNGNFPLWNPLSFSGSPFFANFQSGILHPLTLLYFVLPTVLAWSLSVVVQPLLAAIFTYLFLRNLKLDKISSILGGIIYAFSGFSIIWLEYNIHGHVAALVPLLFLLVDKFLEKKGWGLVLSLVLAIQIFAGYPQVTLYSFFFLIFYFVYRLFGRRRETRKVIKKGASFALFLFLGVSLAAVQLIPGFELLRLSQRSVEGIPGGESLAFLPWPQLMTFLAPDFFGNPATGNFWYKGDYTNTVGYAGLTSLALAMIGLLWAKRKEKWLFLFLAITILVYVLPTPVAYLVRKLNFFAFGAAASTRAIAPLNFAFAVLASIGFDFIWQRKSGKKIGLFKIPFYILVVLVGLAVGVFLARRVFLSYELVFFNQEEALKAILTWTLNLKVSLRNLVLPFMLASALVILFWLMEKINSLRKLFLLLIFLLLTFELFRFGWKYTTFTQKELIFPKTPVIDFLIHQEKPFRILGGDVIPMNMWSAFGLESPAGYDAVYPLRYALFLNVLNSGQGGKLVSRYGDIKRYDSRLIDLINVKYVLALKRDEFNRVNREGNKMAPRFQLPKLKLVFEDKTVQVLENTTVYPRAFVVYEYQVETGEKEIINALLDPKFVLRDKVVLEEVISQSLKEGKVNQVAYSQKINGANEILVDHEGNGLLFVSDSYYPGWKAFIDGKETKIYRANFTFRAVFVPAGEHVVRFIYDPQSFKIGVGISVASLIFLATIFLYEFIKIRYSSQKRSP